MFRHPPWFGLLPLAHGVISCTVTVLSSGSYSTLKNMLVTVPAAPEGVADPGGLLPSGALLDEVFTLALLVLPRARLPITLKFTVNGSLLGLLNLRLRIAESSFAVRALSAP